MVRRCVFVAGVLAVVMVAFVAGASVTVPVTAQPKDAAKAAVVGQKTGYFNMAAVMRDYERAKVSVAKMNERRVRMSANLAGLRAMFTDLRAAQTAVKEKPGDGGVRAREIADDIVAIGRIVEDMDRVINRQLNDQASAIIGELYDEIYAVVSEMAQDHGLVAVLAYPDAVTVEEKNNPYLKELKLKPPAAQPFYIDPSVNFTGEIIKRLNAR